MSNLSKLRPYLAIDLETTGLAVDKVHILQLGWVIDDGVSPRDQLKKGSIIIKEPFITYGESFALQMNAWLFQEMDKKTPKYTVAGVGFGLKALLYAIEEAATLAYAFDVKNGEARPMKKIQLAGKNVGSFDWPIIRNTEKRENMHLFGLDELVDHRFIDCGALFFEQFGRNPGFDKINKLMGWKDINHDALDDAMNVVVAVRYRMGMNF